MAEEETPALDPLAAVEEKYREKLQALMAERDAIGATLGEVSSQFSSQLDALKGSGVSSQEQIERGIKYSELHAQARVGRDVHLGRLAQADVAIERLFIQKATDEAAAKAAMASAAEEE